MYNSKAFVKNYLFLLFSVLFKIFFDWYVVYYLGNFSSPENSLFLLEILGANFYLPHPFYVFVDLVVLLLVFILGKFLFFDLAGLIMAFLYAISPWSSYMVLGKSAYLLSLVFLLSLFILVRKFFLTGESKYLLFLTIFFLLLIATDFYFLFLLPFFLFLIFWTVSDRNDRKKIKKLLVLAVFIILFFSPFLFINKVGFINILQREISVFSDIGPVNYVNDYRGILTNAGFGFWGKFVENKYFYYLRYFLFNLLKNIAPATYFTGQEKMLGFSITPPLFLGLLPVFFVGVWKVAREKRKFFLNSVLLILFFIIPSALSYPSPDLNKLFIIFPFLLLFSSEGLVFLLAEKKNLKARFILFLLVFIVLVQMLSIFYDISTREPIRMIM